jgi:HEAT repeat protein
MRTIALIALSIGLAGCGRDTAYRGKPLSQWQKGLDSGDAKLRRESADAIGKIGTSASPAIPNLIEALKDPDAGVRAKTAAALWSMGPAASPALQPLQDALGDANAEVRLNAAGALGEIGPKAMEAAPALARTLRQDANANVRGCSARALAKIHSADKSLSALMQALQDRDNNVRIKAAYALAEFGPSAKTSIPALDQAMKNADGNLRGAIAYALRTIQGK